jgi:hypothetical protein
MPVIACLFFLASVVYVGNASVCFTFGVSADIGHYQAQRAL